MVLKARIVAPDWSAGRNPAREAKCLKFGLPENHVVNADTDPWFEDEREAADVCNGTWDEKVCNFRQRCLHWALINNEQAGTFGGMTVHQRRWIRRNKERIPRNTWPMNDEWRDIVPPAEYFEDNEGGEDFDDDSETEEF